MAQPEYTVGIIGGGRLGQYYIEVYDTLPDTEVIGGGERFCISTRQRYGVERSAHMYERVNRAS